MVFMKIALLKNIKNYVIKAYYSLTSISGLVFLFLKDFPATLLNKYKDIANIIKIIIAHLNLERIVFI